MKASNLKPDIKMKDIKAPAHLKQSTIARAEQMAYRRTPKPAICALTACGLLSALVLSHSLFSAPAAPIASPSPEQLALSGEESLPIHAADSSADQSAQGVVNQNPEELIPYFTRPQTDNTSSAALNVIKENYTLQKPLSEYRISCAYNDFQENGLPLHPEVDMAADEGTPVYSISVGTVLETGFSTDLGNYIIIDHGDGLISTYGHCKDILLNTGDAVTIDHSIATVGKTGMATGAFLSLAVTLNGTPVNPERLFE